MVPQGEPIRTGATVSDAGCAGVPSSAAERALSAAEGYRLWAPTYADETAISHLENGLATRLTPPLAGLRLLDAGCGTGRRVRASGAAFSVGVDLSPEMLQAGVGQGRVRADLATAVGDVRDLPLPDRAFDVVWCRLVLGHLQEIGAAYRELARVTEPGGHVLVTDFHPQAAAAGHRRTFRTAQGRRVELEHHVHDPHDHESAAAAAGLDLVQAVDGRVGPEIGAFYAAAGRLEAYQAQLGLPVVLALLFRRSA